MISRLERLVGPLAIFLTLIAAVPYGSNRPWAWIVFGVLAGCLLLLQMIIDLARSDEVAACKRQLGFMPWAILLIIVWILYQSSGLPPMSWHHPIYAELPHTESVKSAISILPDKGAQYGLRLATYLVLFWIVYRYTTRFRNAEAVLIGICLGYTIFALYTFTTVATGLYKTHVLWLPHPWSGVAPSGTFVNQNHFAAHMAIGAISAMGLVIGRYRKFAHHSIKDKRAARQILLKELIAPRFIFIGTMFLAISFCVLLTGSQAAIWSFFIALITLFGFGVLPGWGKAIVTAFDRLGSRMQTSIVFLIGAVGLALVSWIVAPAISGADPFRANIYANIPSAVSDNFWIGTGAGTFLEAFAPYKGAVGANHAIAHAHNTFFQNILELGVPAAALLYLVLSRVFVLHIQGTLKRRQRRWVPAVGVAVIVYAGLHSILDFSFELPANAAMLSIILAATLAQSRPSTRS